MSSAPSLSARPVAVIDIGSTAVRMTVAQILPDGEVKELDFLQQAVTLGKDTFTQGYIGRANIEGCVKALKGFRGVLPEYGVTTPEQVFAVATSAVREASNRETFLDRIYMATGIRVDPVSDADLTRLTYLSIQPCLQQDSTLARSRLLVTEVSGGNTELILLRRGNISLSETHHLGVLRMLEMYETTRAPLSHQRELMERNITRTVAQIHHVVGAGDTVRMLALGGDIRFAATQILPEWPAGHLASVPVDRLVSLTDDLLALSAEATVRKYKLPFSDAETVGPALLVYATLAQSFGLDEIIATDITMRHGLLMEVAGKGGWNRKFAQQIVRSAAKLARKYKADLRHARHVAELAKAVFAALRPEHGLDQRHEMLLTVASLLHDVGLFVSNRSHHKHSLYLIANSPVFGLSSTDLRMVALIARYHRRSAPKPTHVEYVSLKNDDRLAVSQLAAILRVADALDRSDSQRIRQIACVREDDRFVITAPGVDDVTLEQMALQRKGSLFEDVYGVPVALRCEPCRPE